MSREGQQSAGAPSVEGDLGRPSAATGQEATDPVFAAEQAHLSETYGKLEKIGRDAIAAMEAVARDAAEDKKSMAFTVLFTPKEEAFGADTVDGYVKKILKQLGKTYGIELRS